MPENHDSKSGHQPGRAVDALLAAERLLEVDHVASLMRCATALEFILQHLADRAGILYAEMDLHSDGVRAQRKSAHDLIAELLNGGEIPRHVADAMHTIRKAGNAAKHDGSGDLDTARWCFSQLQLVYTWAGIVTQGSQSESPPELRKQEVTAPPRKRSHPGLANPSYRTLQKQTRTVTGNSVSKKSPSGGAWIFFAVCALPGFVYIIWDVTWCLWIGALTGSLAFAAGMGIHDDKKLEQSERDSAFGAGCLSLVWVAALLGVGLYRWISE